jgi:hypothetical protein
VRREGELCGNAPGKRGREGERKKLWRSSLEKEGLPQEAEDGNKSGAVRRTAQLLLEAVDDGGAGH